MIGTPGGELAKRPLHFILLVDCSGSMQADGKIQALNNAAREALPALRDAAAGEPHAEVLVRVLAFSDGARWIVSQPTPVETFDWTDLQAGGVTDMGRAMSMTAEVLAVPPMEPRALPPVLLLISDGKPTDDFSVGLNRLLSQPWGRAAVKIAIAIGRDADFDILARFIDNLEIKPVRADNPEQLVRHMRWASTAVKAASRPQTDMVSPVAVPQPPSSPLAMTGVADVTW